MGTKTLNDGTRVTIRAIRPDDKERLVDAFSHLQPRTIRMRFFYAKKSLTEDELHWVDETARGRHIGLVATVSNAPSAIKRSYSTRVQDRV